MDIEVSVEMQLKTISRKCVGLDNSLPSQWPPFVCQKNTQCNGMNICVPQNEYVEILPHNVMALGGGAFGR